MRILAIIELKKVLNAYKKEAPQTGFLKYVENHFESNTIRCKKTRSNCFGSKKCSTTLRLMLTCFHLPKGRAIFFSARNNCYEFFCILWCYFQSDFQLYFKTPVCGSPFLNYSPSKQLFSLSVFLIVNPTLLFSFFFFFSFNKGLLSFLRLLFLPH